MDVFLAASVPLPRHRRYFDSADVIAIRDSVKSLAIQVLGTGRLVFGGHPAITPLLALILREMFPERRGNIILYQSEYFTEKFPEENDEFVDVRIIPKIGSDKERSLLAMREKMLLDFSYDAGVFIGGKEGVSEEFELFRKFHPDARCFPIASSGGAALEIYKGLDNPIEGLLTDLTYPTLFRNLLG